MKKIVLSAFACDPTKGSEPSHGWNWAIGLASKGFQVHCFTRIIGKDQIEAAPKPNNIIFYYITLPFGGEKLYGSSTAGMYLYYIIWQWLAYRKAKALHKKNAFVLAHHTSWGSTQLGSFMYKLGVPFIFGPAGGGQEAPVAFKNYFLNHWATEQKREKISKLMLKFNPACKNMLKKAFAVLVVNPDTERMVKSAGAKNVGFVLDSALPKTFFPESPIFKIAKKGELNLLWTGRFLPRKGLLLLLDVMRELSDYPGIKLTVVGDGEMKDVFLNKINEYKLEDSVSWKGRVSHDEVKQFYSTHDLFFFTSLRDSCPAQLVEAMAFCMPVVTINLHGQAILVDENRGFACECDSPELAIFNLKNAILQFYNNPQLIESKSRASYEFALKQIWDTKIENVIQNYYPKL